jgi:hypothetical protein
MSLLVPIEEFMTETNYLFAGRDTLLNNFTTLDTSGITDFTGLYACCPSPMMPTIDTSNGEIFTNMYSNSSVVAIKSLDISNGKTFTQMFYNCYELEYLPSLDLTNAETYQDMLNFHSGGGGKIKAIREIIGSSLDLNILFHSNNRYDRNQMPNLEYIRLTGSIKTDNDIYTFMDSPKLSVDSLVSIFNALEDNTGGTTITLYIGSENIAKLSDDIKSIVLNKNILLA